MNKVKIALVHDFLFWYGGAERVLESINEIYPDAVVYTSVYSKKNMSAVINRMKIKVSWMQKIPFKSKLLKFFTYFYPTAFESLDLSNFDIVISVTAGAAKSVVTEPGTVHISYTLTTPRFLWGYETAYRSNLRFLKVILPVFDNFYRI